MGGYQQLWEQEARQQGAASTATRGGGRELHQTSVCWTCQGMNETAIIIALDKTQN